MEKKFKLQKIKMGGKIFALSSLMLLLGCSDKDQHELNAKPVSNPSYVDTKTPEQYTSVADLIEESKASLETTNYETEPFVTTQWYETNDDFESATVYTDDYIYHDTTKLKDETTKQGEETTVYSSKSTVVQTTKNKEKVTTHSSKVTSKTTTRPTQTIPVAETKAPKSTTKPTQTTTRTTTRPTQTTTKTTTRPTTQTTTTTTTTQVKEYTIEDICNNTEAFLEFAKKLGNDVISSWFNIGYGTSSGRREAQLLLAVLNDGEISDQVLQEVFSEYTVDEMKDYGKYCFRIGELQQGRFLKYSDYCINQNLGDYFEDLENAYYNVGVEEYDNKVYQFLCDYDNVVPSNIKDYILKHPIATEIVISTYNPNGYYHASAAYEASMLPYIDELCQKANCKGRSK